MILFHYHVETFFSQLDILRGIHADLATLANEVNHLLGFQGGNWFMLPRELNRNTFYMKHILFGPYKLKFFVIESTGVECRNQNQA